MASWLTEPSTSEQVASAVGMRQAESATTRAHIRTVLIRAHIQHRVASINEASPHEPVR